MTKNIYNYCFYVILSLLIILLFYISNSLSISYKEALNVFVNNSLLSYLTKISIFIFGQNDYALRLPFIIFYTLSVLLLYKITDNYFKLEKDRFFTILIFMFLPGTICASVLVNSSIIVTFFLLLFIYVNQNYSKYSNHLLFIYLFIDNSFAILYLALFFYSLNKKNKNKMYITASLFIASIFIYGLSTGGKPKSFVLDTFAIYASIFSIFIFIYYMYTIYKIGFKGKKDLIWYISTTSLLLSFLFSFRQKIYIEDFGPYIVIALPLVLKNFYHSYRCRLKRFRKMYNVAIYITLFMLILNVSFLIFNKPIYYILPNPEKHFIYKYHFAKEIANKLKEKNINNITTNDNELQLRLKFYKINKGNSYFISKKPIDNYFDKFNLNYKDKILMTIYIKKLNN